MPSIHTDDITGDYIKPRVIKTHFPFDPIYKKVIHLIRDPRAVIVSYFHFTMGEGGHYYSPITKQPTFYEFVDMFSDGQIWPGDLQKHSASYINQANNCQYFQLIYENLLEHPRGEIRRLMDFLEIDLSSSNINRVTKHTSFKNMSRLHKNESALNGTGFSEKHKVLRKGKSHNFRKELSSAANQHVQNRFLDYLTSFGYPIYKY